MTQQTVNLADWRPTFGLRDYTPAERRTNWQNYNDPARAAMSIRHCLDNAKRHPELALHYGFLIESIFKRCDALEAD